MDWSENMEILDANRKMLKEIKAIYLEAFPKAERKPFFTISRGVKRGKVQIMTAVEGGFLQGFIMMIPYKNTVMVDYLAVSGKVRSNGTGSKLLQEACRRFHYKKILLLIEKVDSTAANNEQRVARRNFYLKNGFGSSDIYITGKSGDMEIMSFGGRVSPQEYMELQEYALGKFMFRMSAIRLDTKEG